MRYQDTLAGRLMRLAKWSLVMSASFAPAVAQLEADLILPNGVISLVLDPETAPLAVTNFIGLAKGEKAWLSTESGEIRQDPFYNGVVVKKNVGGLEVTADSPGYVLPDESLNSSNSVVLPYSVALVSDGPNRAGSRFVVFGNQPSPPPSHFFQVFGSVSAQSRSAVDALMTSGSDMLIESVAFRASGGFVLPQVSLPSVLEGESTLRINMEGVEVQLVSPLLGPSLVYSYQSTDLRSWGSPKTYFLQVSPNELSGWLSLGAQSETQEFFRFVSVHYPDAPAVNDFSNRTLTSISPAGGTIVYTFNETGLAGTWAFPEIGFTGNFTVQEEPAPSFHPINFELTIFAEGAGGIPYHEIKGGWDGEEDGVVKGRHFTRFMTVDKQVAFADSGTLSLK